MDPITALQAKRAGINERIQALAVLEATGTELSAEQLAEFTALEAQFKAIDAQIGRATAAEAAAAAPAVPVAAAGVATTEIGAGSHRLTLGLAQASWVEVTSVDGRRLEYGLLPADSQRTFRSEQGLLVRIGNASGATVTLDGQPVALDTYRHANVARFRVTVQGASANAAGF